jgi:Nitroreductase family
MSVVSQHCADTTKSAELAKKSGVTKPVPIGLIRECLEIAMQAPTSANVPNWSLIVVTDAEQRRALGDVYGRTWDLIVASRYTFAIGSRKTPRNREQRKVSDSAAYLAEDIGEVPVLMIPCVEVIDGDGALTQGHDLLPCQTDSAR